MCISPGFFDARTYDNRDLGVTSWTTATGAVALGDENVKIEQQKRFRPQSTAREQSITEPSGAYVARRLPRVEISSKLQKQKQKEKEKSFMCARTTRVSRVHLYPAAYRFNHVIPCHTTHEKMAHTHTRGTPFK